MRVDGEFLIYCVEMQCVQGHFLNGFVEIECFPRFERSNGIFDYSEMEWRIDLNKECSNLKLT